MYPTASAPQYAFGPALAPVPMPGMAGGGLASLPVKRFQSGGASTAPRYSYNPITQSYTLLTPKQQFNQSSDGGVYPSSQYGSFGEGTPADTNPSFSQMTPTDQAAYYAANPTMAAVTQTGLNALGVTSLGMLQNALDPIGVAQAHTIAQGIDPSLATPLGPPGVVSVSPIAPDQTANLAAMNAQQQQQTSPSAVAGAVADAVANFADTQDAEAGQNVGVAPTAAPTAAPDNAPTASAPDNAPSGNDDGPSNPFAQFAGQENHGMFSDSGGYSTEATIGVDANDAPSNDGAENSGVYYKGGRVMNYEQGGFAAAQQTQSKGRGQDTMLVHMTPGEVKGLQALAMSQGGSLTINPETGLPEAGFLQRLLPAILGAGLTIASGGALTPLMAAGIVGGGYGVAKGSLKEGLMAGLGAYGGAGLGSGLTTAGQAASSATQTAAIPADAAAAGVTGPMAPTVSGLEAAKLGAQNLLEPGGFKAITSAMPIGSGVAATTTALKALTPEPEPLKPSISNIRPYSLDVSNPSGTPQYTPQDTREREQVRYTFSPQPIYQAAQGGLAALNGQTYDDEYGRDEYKAGGLSALDKRRKSLSGDKYYKFADSRRDQSMEAAIEQNFAKGGLPPRFLEGAGDGMSDSIKARIGGVQEARLADGEFVVPADVVSHLGNGSSKAGAKKLYAMMDKIRKARTGRERQAPEVNAQKYMPA